MATQQQEELAPGDWKPGARFEEPSTIYLVVECQRTKDAVQAIVHVGSLDKVPRTTWGLPPESDLPPDSIWYLYRLSLRGERRAIGGTTSLLDFLSKCADEAGAWLVTCVDPTYGTEEDGIKFLKKHGNFVSSPDPKYPHLMHRKPHDPPPP